MSSSIGDTIRDEKFIKNVIKPTYERIVARYGIPANQSTLKSYIQKEDASLHPSKNTNRIIYDYSLENLWEQPTDAYAEKRRIRAYQFSEYSADKKAYRKRYGLRGFRITASNRFGVRVKKKGWKRSLTIREYEARRHKPKSSVP